MVEKHGKGRPLLGLGFPGDARPEGVRSQLERGRGPVGSRCRTRTHAHGRGYRDHAACRINRRPDRLGMAADTSKQPCRRSDEVSAHMVRLVLLAAFLVLASLACGGGPDAVKMGTEGAYPPYNFIGDDGEVAGFERELGDELCRRAELDCSWVTNDWDSIIPNLGRGRLRHHHGRDEHHGGAGRGHRLHPAVHSAHAVGLHSPGRLRCGGYRGQGRRPGGHHNTPSTWPGPARR